jgi:hypothetical protein
MAGPANGDQKLVLQIVAALSRIGVNTTAIAHDLTLQQSHVQKYLAEICFNLIGYWAEFGENVDPAHPLAAEYETARKMREALF